MTTMEPVHTDANRPGSPITEADLHAYVDRQLTPVRHAEVERYLAERPDEAERVQAWQQQNVGLHALFDPVLGEALPLRLPVARRAVSTPWRALAAGFAIALLSAALAWVLRGVADGAPTLIAAAPRAGPAAGGASAPGAEALSGFAHRAAVAHAVYSPEVRRPVEVGADQEQQLVTWLSKRLGSPVRAPSLSGLGYDLVGGRLLPGDRGPVAQLMYQDDAAHRLTLYVTREAPRIGGEQQTAFRFGREGNVNVFYWVDRDFGYALSGAADRAALLRIAHEVHRQLAPG
jgi:anti-sigma factor RsiW